MEIMPILASLRRNTIGALLIGLQIALTLAIVCNALAIIHQHAQQMARPSGVAEAEVFTLENAWVGNPADLKARTQADMAAIRTMPGVLDAYATNSFPLAGGGWSTTLDLRPDQQSSTVHTSLYFVDDHALQTLGLHLIAGRWFASNEIREMQVHDNNVPDSVVVTRSVAQQAFPAGNALGQQVYVDGKPTRIVGIVERAQTPWATSSWGEQFIENSMFLPLQLIDNGLDYVVRTRPGQQDSAIRQVQQRLYSVSRQRVIENVQPFAQTRATAYAVPYATNVILVVVCSLLLVITIFGIVGLTMYWVAQRRRQIGMRRALGARRIDILRYFHLENLLVSGTGAVLGVALGLALNLWLVTHLALGRMSSGYICCAALIVVACSQAAVLWPAMRAASISPATATRVR